MRNVKIYFNKENIIEALNNEAFKPDSKTTAREMDEITCLLRIVDKVKLDKKHKSVIFMVKAYDKAEIKLGFENHMIEKTGMYEIFRECMKEQLINKEFVTTRKYGYVLLGYDVEVDDSDMIAALESCGIV